jgi:hypothetical protein
LTSSSTSSAVAKSKFRTEEQRKYIDLLKGRFHASNVKSIERKDDPDTISNKWADFSFRTIREMISDGYEEAVAQIRLEN